MTITFLVKMFKLLQLCNIEMTDDFQSNNQSFQEDLIGK